MRGVDLEVPPQRRPHVGEPVAVGAEHDIGLWHEPRDRVGHRLHPVGDRDDRTVGAADLFGHVRRARRLGGVQAVPAFDVERVGEQRLRFERVQHHRSAREDLRAVCTRFRRGAVAVDAAHDAVLDARGHGRLRVVLVVEREVIEAVFVGPAVHATDAVAHEHADLVRERRVVRPAVRDSHRGVQRLPVAVLQALSRQRRTAGGGAEQEALPALVAVGPDLVAHPLEPEHRIEDEERDQRIAPGGVRRGRGRERRHRAGLGDALFEELTGRRLAVRQHQRGVDRLVELSERRIDLELREQRVHAERARLVGDDRDDAGTDLGILQQRAQQTRERHRRGGRDLLAGTGRQLVDDLVAREHDRLRAFHALGKEPVERAPALHQVLALRRVRGRDVVGRVTALQRLVGDLEVEPVAEPLEVVDRHLLDLVRRVPAFDVGAEGPTLHRLGQDDGRRAFVLDRGLVRRVELPVVVAAARELLQVVVAQVLDHLAQPGVGPEEVLTDVGT